MKDSKIHKVLKQIDRGTLKSDRLKLICQKLCENGLIAESADPDSRVAYKLTIQGKIFMWDYENWKL